MTTPITFNVNTPFVSRIVAAFRAEFPTLTLGLADGPAVKTVIRQFVADIVSTYEAGQATGSIRTQVATLAASYETTYAAQQAQTQSDTQGGIS